MEHKYEMTVNLQVINHLGLNLYSNTSAVLSEAVANSWDADATSVDITVGIDTITISDNGCGMNVDDINNKYLTVGYQKRLSCARTPSHNRLVMGRKGIGKLSLFSIAKEITILSVKDGEKNALRISTDVLLEAIKTNGNYYPEELDVNTVDFTHNGTKIILSNLKKRTATLSTHLRQRIARRFSVIDGSQQFAITINGEAVTASDRNYLSKAQCLWIIPPTGQDATIFVQNIEAQCNPEKLKQKYTLPVLEPVSPGCMITGWLATVPTPSELTDDENINRIVIIVRGKMAKEDILPELSSTALYTKYLMGEIYADFLDEDDNDDIATSNRQDFFEDDERYKFLISTLQSYIQRVRSDWEEFRSEAGTENACRYEVVRSWYDDLRGDDKSSAKKLFGKINQLTVDEDEKRSLFKHGVLAFESCKLRHELSALDSVEAEDVDAFLRVAGRLDSIEASMYYEIVTERLAVIKRMREVTTDGSLERVIQEHLGKNLWLFDPSWDRGTETPQVEISIKTYFDGIFEKFTQEEKESRFDIAFKKVSNKHIVIELKRGNRTLKRQELYEQISKYSEAMEKALTATCPGDQYEIIVLLGKPVEGWDLTSSSYQRFIDSLSAYKCRIMYYSELLANAENMYKDFLEKNEESSVLGALIQRIDEDQ